MSLAHHAVIAALVALLLAWPPALAKPDSKGKHASLPSRKCPEPYVMDVTGVSKLMLLHVSSSASKLVLFRLRTHIR